MQAPHFVALAALAALAPAQERVTFAGLLDAVTDLERLWRAPPMGERCIQFSSYDRRSQAGPQDADAWYANEDYGKFLRVEERGGRHEHVLVDAAGPGSVVRIWSANPKGTLRFYVDTAEGGEPTWTIPFQELCGGKTPPFVEPLAGVRARGWNCHLPVPFAKRLEVTCDESNFYYQVNVRLFPPGTAVEPFAPALLAEHAARLEAVASTLSAAGRPDPRPDDHQGTASAATTGDIELWRAGADGVLRLLEITVLDGDEARRGARLVIESAGETLVDVPLADFFASAPGMRTNLGYALGVRPQGSTGYCRLPMPLEQGARLLVRADVPYRVEHRLRFEPGPLPSDALRLRASWHLASRLRTLPFSDHRVLDAKGLGRFVGCALHVANPARPWWGEGDEKFFVDGESFPSTFGTGTEDYFGYAWCSPQLFQHPLHGQPRCDGPANFGHTCVHRFQLADAVPFQQSFRFDLEVWYGARGKQREVDYATTAFWYGAPGATSGLGAVPPAEARQPRQLELPQPWIAKGALEAESLPCQVTRGKARRQELSEFESGRWSRDGQLWWTDAEVGDRLTLELPVEAAGRYRITARFTKANDYGIVQASFGGRDLGAPIDLYHESVLPSDEIALGDVELAAGKQPLVFAITGRNPRAAAKHMVGIDYLRLEKR